MNAIRPSRKIWSKPSKWAGEKAIVAEVKARLCRRVSPSHVMLRPYKVSTRDPIPIEAFDRTLGTREDECVGVRLFFSVLLVRWMNSLLCCLLNAISVRWVRPPRSSLIDLAATMKANTLWSFPPRPHRQKSNPTKTTMRAYNWSSMISIRSSRNTLASWTRHFAPGQTSVHHRSINFRANRASAHCSKPRSRKSPKVQQRKRRSTTDKETSIERNPLKSTTKWIVPCIRPKETCKRRSSPWPIDRNPKTTTNRRKPSSLLESLHRTTIHRHCPRKEKQVNLR